MGRLKPDLIIGGPGCGKTTELLKIVEKAVASGIKLDRIAFVAFTRKAAEEARARIVRKFDVSIDDIPYFKTLHSFAFAHLDVQSSQILTPNKLREYAKAEGLNLSKEYIDEFGQSVPSPATPDERALTASSLSKLTGRPLDDTAIDMDVGFDFASKVAGDYEAFKRDAILYDFTDMIDLFTTKGTVPDLDLLIVDEAQDLSKLQWRMVNRIADYAKDIYFAGDDDQAIYAWAGADVEHFLSLDANRRVLPISYRLKSKVFDACVKVIKNCDHRYEKDWKPHAEGGEIDYVTYLEDLDLSKGTWYLLARTNSLVRKFTKFLQNEGWAYFSPTKDGMKASTDTDLVRAILVYENLRKGRRFYGDDMSLCWEQMRSSIRPTSMPEFSPTIEYGIADLCSTGFNAELTWLEALSVSGGLQTYIRAMRARGESLIKPPRITASTIHGVKGGEADNVLVYQKLTTLTYKNWVNGDPQEVRALFTAMSRAKDRLIFLEARTRKSYSIERLLI